LAPCVAPHYPFDLRTRNLLAAFTPPSWTERGNKSYFLGTDDQGRDVISAIIFGSRMSLVIGLAATLLAMVVGVTLGLISGYVGGKLDAFIMRVADVQLSFPAILIALLIDGLARAALPKELHDQLALYVLVFAIAASGWVSYARTVRGATLSFLGVGVPPTKPSLGTLIRIGNDFLFSGEWWITVFPGAALVLLVLSINVVG